MFLHGLAHLQAKWAPVRRPKMLSLFRIESGLETVAWGHAT
jgi:hypothetical protein